MGISTIVNRVSYSGNGTSALFPFQYEFHSTSDLICYIWNSSRVPVSNILTFGVDYTVSGTPDAQGRYPNGGTVIINSTPAATDIITIFRETTPTNPYTLGYNQTITSKELMKALDRLAIIEQRILDLSSRSIKLADGFPLSFSTDLPDQLPPNSTLIVDAAGTGISIVSGSSLFTTVNSGVVGAAFGGTGTPGPYTAGSLIFGTSATEFASFPMGTPGQVLQVNSGIVSPVWGGVNVSTASGILPQANGGTGSASSFPQFSVLVQTGPTTLGAALPAAAGTALMANASSAPSFQAIAATPVAPTTTNTAITLTPAINTLIMNSGNYTVTLYDAVGNGGRDIFLIKNGFHFDNPITISGSGSQLIGLIGASVRSYTHNEVWHLRSNDTNWNVLNHHTKTELLLMGSSVLTSAAGIVGTTTVNHIMFGRDGEYADIVFALVQPAGGVNATDGIRINMPNGMKINTQKTLLQSSVTADIHGAPGVVLSSVGMHSGGGASWGTGQAVVYSSSAVRLSVEIGGGIPGAWGSAINNFSSNTLNVNATWRVPIAGWLP